MKIALVTGGTGFLGKYLIDGLLEKGYAVRSFDLRPPLEKKNRTEYILGDIRYYDGVLRASMGCEIIYHLASIPSIAGERYKTYLDINVIGAENVLKAAKECGIKKVIFVSSSTVYGVPEKCPLKEDDAVKNVGYYGKSKIEAEKLCWDYTSPELTVAIIRPRVIMGAGRIGVFSLLFDAVLEDKAVYLIGKGKNIFQFTGVRDMTNALLLASEYHNTRVFNIGSKDKTIVLDVIKGLIRHAGSRSRIVLVPPWIARTALKIASFSGVSPLVKEQFMIADRDFMLDTSMAERELGWRPTQSNLECLIEAFDWYKENKKETKGQFKKLIGVFGRFRHSRQGAFQDSDK